jgi:hypothetical protein
MDVFQTIGFETSALLCTCLSAAISYFMGSASRPEEAAFWGIVMFSILMIAISVHSLMRGDWEWKGLPDDRKKELQKVDSRFAVYYIIVLMGFLYGLVRGR